MTKNYLGRPRAVAVGRAGVAAPALAAGEGIEIERKKWSFSGPGGHFDKNQLQRGFQVYKEVCATCHGMTRIAFRNLMEKGGPAVSGGRRAFAGRELQDRRARRQRQGRAARRAACRTASRRPTRTRSRGARDPQRCAAAGSVADRQGPRRRVHRHASGIIRSRCCKDIATGYQEGGADYLYALLTGYKDKAPAYRRDGGKLVAVAEIERAADEKAVMRCVAVEQGEGGKPDSCTPMADGHELQHGIPRPPDRHGEPLRDNDSRVKYGDGTRDDGVELCRRRRRVPVVGGRSLRTTSARAWAGRCCSIC